MRIFYIVFFSFHIILIQLKVKLKRIRIKNILILIGFVSLHTNSIRIILVLNWRVQLCVCVCSVCSTIREKMSCITQFWNKPTILECKQSILFFASYSLETLCVFVEVDWIKHKQRTPYGIFAYLLRMFIQERNSTWNRSIGSRHNKPNLHLIHTPHTIRIISYLSISSITSDINRKSSALVAYIHRHT